MLNFEYITKEGIKEYNPNWPQIPDHPCRILNSQRFCIYKKDALHNLINHQQSTDKFYLYANDPYEAEYKLLINKLEGAVIKHFHDSESFIEYSNDVDDIYKNIEEYNPKKERKNIDHI